MRPVLVFAMLASAQVARASDSFEIQVFHAEQLNAAKQVSLELHSNYVPVGLNESVGLAAARGKLFENLEPVVGITRWWEVGLHLQAALRPDSAGPLDWGGIRLRSQFHFPWAEQRVPLHLGLNVEAAYQPPRYYDVAWAMEIRPILELLLGYWDFDFNPVFIFALSGPNAGVPTFEPAAAVRVGRDQLIGVSLEYYGETGVLNHVLPVMSQGHYLFATFDMRWPRWSLRVGIGHGLTPASSPLVFTTILEYRFNRVRDQDGSDHRGSRQRIRQ